MRLYVFSEDSGGRESCSIFYAGYVVIDADETEASATLDELLKRDERGEPDWEDDSVRQLSADMGLLVEKLRERGLRAWTPEPVFLVEEYE